MHNRLTAAEKFVYPIFALIFFICIWGLAVSILNIPNYLVPSPVQVGSLLLNDSKYLLFHTITTIAEAIVGLAIAVVVALCTASLLTFSSRARAGLVPLVIASQTIPIIAIAPVLTLWFGVGFWSKAIMAAVLCWFPLVMNATRGFLDIDPTSLAVFETYRASKAQTFAKLRLPHGLSQVVAGIRISAGLAMIGAVVAEYVGADRGLGYVVTQASYRLETDRLFAAVLCGAAAGVLLAELVYNLSLLAYRWFLRGTPNPHNAG